jgi:hypothetical protein
MTQKVVNITIKNLDITQLSKCADAFRGHVSMQPCSVSGAYNKELYAFIQQLIEAGYAGQQEVRAVHLTI